METLYIEDLKGNKTAITEINGCFLLSIDDQGPQPSTNYVQNVGLDGQDDGETTYGLRIVSANFSLKGIDKVDYTFAVQEVWRKLFSRDALYISWSRMPGMRYLVHTRPFQFTKLNAWHASFTVEFEAFRGLRESVGTTLDPFEYDSELWQLGQNLPSDEDLQYIFTNNRFNVYNASDITIDPERKHLLQIALTCDGTPTIINHTTGSIFMINDPVSKSDVLLIDGIYPYLNNQHCGRSTNHGVIQLAPGDNDIEISGASNILCSWLFRYLFL